MSYETEAAAFLHAERQGTRSGDGKALAINPKWDVKVLLGVKMRRMLVTDDDPCLLAMYQALFSRLTGVTVDYAATPSACKKLLSKRKYDLALLDISLGDGQTDGFALLRDIRTKTPRTEVLMMSSMDGEETVARCKLLGATSFTSKNAGFSERLQALVNELLNEKAPTNFGGCVSPTARGSIRAGSTVPSTHRLSWDGHCAC